MLISSSEMVVLFLTATQLSCRIVKSCVERFVIDRNIVRLATKIACFLIYIFMTLQV